MPQRSYMATRIGKLNQPITIIRAAETVTASGGTVEDWDNPTTVASCFAQIEATYGMERDAASKITAEMMYAITIRYRLGITPKMRVVEGSPARTFDIIAVAEVPGEYKRRLELLCRENLNG